MEKIYLEVALPVSLYETFTYSVDRNLVDFPEEDLIGRRVIVPFKFTKHVGIITGLKENLENIDFQLKDVLAFPDKYPVFTKKYIEIIKKLSRYYVVPLGMALFYSMPDALRWEYEKGSDKWKKKISESYIYYPITFSVDSIKRLSKRGKELLSILIEKGELTEQEIKELGFSKKVINTLIKREIIKKESIFFKEDIKKFLKSEHRIYSAGKLDNGFFLYKSVSFEERINKYINWIGERIYKGESCLLIFPTVKHVKLAYEKLKPIFQDKLYTYFDGLTSKEKLKTWIDLKRYKGLVCLGTYPSAFIPIKDLSLIVLDEEHSDNYKMLRTPRFDIRRLVYEIFLSKNKNLSLVFTTYTPSVETYLLLKQKKLKEIKNENFLSYFNAKLIVNNPPFPKLENYIISRLSLDEKTLIVVNRKGLASYLYCEVCEREIYCLRCDIPVKVHEHKDIGKFLQCPICNKKYSYIENCPKCDNRLKEKGFGIEKLNRTLTKKFPEKVSYLRSDIDTPIKITTVLTNYETLTPEFDTVINIYPDIFPSGSFKSDERYFRNVLIPYLKAKKRYLLLTNSSEHKAIESIRKKNLEIFYKDEMEKRKTLGYPPFRNFILLTFEGRHLTLEKVEEIFNQWLKEFNLENLDYEGVYFAYYPYVREKFRYNIILKDLKEKKALEFLFLYCSKKNIKLTIDVSPRDII